MFTTNHRPQSFHHHLQQPQYAPSPLSSSPLAASPLSPRCDNLPTQTPDQNYAYNKSYDRERIMSSPTPQSSRTNSNSNSSSIFTPAQLSSSNTSTSRSHSAPSSRFSKRATKYNPLMHANSEEGRETRRKLFLKKVREGSEEKRWQNRGGEEEIMRVLWCGEERRRLEGLRAQGGWVVDGGEESLEEVEVDEVARAEEEEMGYLRSLEEEQFRQMGGEGFGRQQQESAMSVYGSDDEEYDDIFQDVVGEEMRLSQQSQQNQQQQGDNGVQDQDQDQDMMDMS